MSGSDIMKLVNFRFDIGADGVALLLNTLQLVVLVWGVIQISV